ncbi:hypothetical protein [Bacteroides sp. UBA939]|uniref:hypothetical protein n=1 Tax=Bacteroides sp. UBA939 TaxID=1946092 RepID=UPI0025BBDC4A|nr:hypothetical protein [Bacteroides sp. UBA939]
MYVGREYKRQISRVIGKSDGKSVQQFKMKDIRKNATIIPLILQRAAIADNNINKTIQRVKTIVIELLPSSPTHLTTDAQNVNRRKHYISLRLGRDQKQYERGLRHGVIPPAMIAAPAPSPVANSLGQIGTIGVNETLIIVSHGARYVPIFAFRTPAMLARGIFNSRILPVGYSGQIYLDGCHTGEPGLLGTLGDGSSYAEKFKRELRNLSGMETPSIYGDFTVKGNLGAAMTSRWGTEWIEGDNRTERLIRDNIGVLPATPLANHFDANHRRNRNTSSVLGLRNTTVTDYRGSYTKIEF